MHDIIAFSSEGERILGVVIEHYTNPLDDFYVVYAGYTLYRVKDSKENAIPIIENVIIPACDAALSDYRLLRQHLKDMGKSHKDIDSLIKVINSNMDTDSLFEENTV